VQVVTKSCTHTATTRRHHVPTLSDFTATTITGEEQPLEEYAGKVALVVNTASKCGFTPQFEGLENLHSEYAEQGLVVLGFPCNQFGNQDPGADEEIGAFCQKNYGVSFPMFSKVDVNGDDAHPLYQWLREEKSGILGEKIKWNFTKFLLARDGTVLKRYGSTTKPEKIAADIEKALAA
jgi:glutathione peroxidase